MKAHRCGQCSQHFPLPLRLKTGVWHTETMLPLQLAPRTCKSNRLGSTLSSSNWKLSNFGQQSFFQKIKMSGRITKLLLKLLEIRELGLGKLTQGKKVLLQLYITYTHTCCIIWVCSDTHCITELPAILLFRTFQ